MQGTKRLYIILSLAIVIVLAIWYSPAPLPDFYRISDKIGIPASIKGGLGLNEDSAVTSSSSSIPTSTASPGSVSAPDAQDIGITPPDESSSTSPADADTSPTPDVPDAQEIGVVAPETPDETPPEHHNQSNTTQAHKAPHAVENASSAAHEHAGTTHPPDTHSTASTQAPSSTSSADEESLFGGGRWFFQDDVEEYPNPKFDVHKLAQYTPRHYKGAGHTSYATFLVTRNGSVHDPYFKATQQLAYRLLWDSRSKTERHPLTIFVAHFVPHEQRDYLRAAGAVVRELPLVEWHPTSPTKAAIRWRDMYSKLNFWNETDYSTLVYLDTDAFPLGNIDALFDMAEQRTCNPDLLPPTDLDQTSICSYVFAAVGGDFGDINAGMIVLHPDAAMHAHLLRELSEQSNADKFEDTAVEQSFLSWAFRQEGPFPAQILERKWNALFTSNEDEGKITVIHEKLWAFQFYPDHFAAGYFNETWGRMLELYETDEFAKLRAEDGLGGV